MEIIMETNYVLAIALGLVVVNEVFALLIGMSIVGNTSLLTIEHYAMLLIDIITGLCIIYIVFMNKLNFHQSVYYYIIILAIIVSHFWRDLETLLNVENEFLGNSPLFIVNNVKLIGFIITLVLSLFILNHDIRNP
jgi:hypothetical protein